MSSSDGRGFASQVTSQDSGASAASALDLQTFGGCVPHGANALPIGADGEVASVEEAPRGIPAQNSCITSTADTSDVADDVFRTCKQSAPHQQRPRLM